MFSATSMPASRRAASLAPAVSLPPEMMAHSRARRACDRRARPGSLLHKPLICWAMLADMPLAGLSCPE